VLALAEAARAEPMRRIAGTVPRAIASLTAAGTAPADLRLARVTVLLGLRDRAALDAVIAAQQDSRSPRFRQWLDAEEIADRFGPSRAEYERVRHWLTARGFSVVADSPYRLAVTVAGTAAQAEAALATPIRLYRRRGRLYRAPAADPVLPESIAASVRGILGLDDLPKFHPAALVDGNEAALVPQDFAAAYGVLPLQAAGLTGAGHSIAVVARSNFEDSDIAEFSRRFGITLNPVRKLTDPSDDPGVLIEAGEETEVLIDTQWAGSLAPGAQLNVVISTPDGDIPEALEKAVVDREGDVITISFGLCEAAAPSVTTTELFDAYYAIANLQGQTVVVAAGDGGATECAPNDTDRLSVNLLASSPHAVAVGGSSFVLDPEGKLPDPLVESVWSDDLGAGGGGVSEVFARPRFQLGPGVPALSGRGLPDVTLPASPLTPGYVIVEDGETRIVGGTSVGAPAFAGILALINERLGRTQGTRGLGQLLPTLYRLGGEQARGLRAPVFRDITIGSNQLVTSRTPGFVAGPGFDLATGWGAPLADALASGVEAPRLCEPEIDCLVPGSRPRRDACAGAWLVEHAPLDRRANGVPFRKQTCRDGDSRCDADGSANGECTMQVALCLNVFDFRFLRRGLPVCGPDVVRRVKARARGRRGDPSTATNTATIRDAIRGLPARPLDLQGACSATVPVTVPVRGARARGRLDLRAKLHARLVDLVESQRSGREVRRFVRPTTRVVLVCQGS
jgi:subtilase family serine protease